MLKMDLLAYEGCNNHHGVIVGAINPRIGSP